ncbi:DUF5518 domain-containing protein [Halohasta salina]|uniref:DUF5518 domain-containing protein n=1 Tax=Halohasta salina TaxID=2961621 RepID=UPI0020A448AD|nr:DUF5518 domain-containing protein [Halohasta salina]
MLQRLAAEATDDAFRVAIAAGLASVPVSLLLSWDSLSGEGVATGPEFDGLALLVAGVLVGFYYHERAASTKRAGIWTGLTGGLAALVVFGLPTLRLIASAAETPSLILLFAPVVAVLGVGLSVAVTVVAAVGTDWVLYRVDPERRRAPAAGQSDRSRWWLVVVGYAVLAPVWLAVLLWPAEVGFGLSFASALGLFACSIAAFVGLFLDATALRCPEGWQPTWWLYVGIPPAVAGVVALVSTLRETGYPAGDGIFGFYAALAAVAVVYAANRRRHGGRLVDPE